MISAWLATKKARDASVDRDCAIYKSPWMATSPRTSSAGKLCRECRRWNTWIVPSVGARSTRAGSLASNHLFFCFAVLLGSNV